MHWISLLFGPLLLQAAWQYLFQASPSTSSVLPFLPSWLSSSLLLSLLGDPLPPCPASPSVTYTMSISMVRLRKGPERTSCGWNSLILCFYLPMPHPRKNWPLMLDSCWSLETSQRNKSAHTHVLSTQEERNHSLLILADLCTLGREEWKPRVGGSTP